jgi:hypothetical protein
MQSGGSHSPQRKLGEPTEFSMAYFKSKATKLQIISPKNRRHNNCFRH